MDILIIGNGFDLAHELPTSYVCFLDFVSYLRKRFANPECLTYKYEKFVDVIECDKTKYEKSKEIVNSNLWLHYFEKVRNKIGQNWIDLEYEISKVIIGLENLKDEKSEVSVSGIPIFTTVGIPSRLKPSSFYTVKHISDFLIKQLNSVVYLLEVYLEEIVYKIDKVKLPFFEKNKFDALLSFNYTNTYDNLYDASIDTHFIHGVVNSEGKNNMVFGIEETLVDEWFHSRNVNFIEFKKYFQRIDKQTGADYKKWITHIVDNKIEPSTIHVFGHSLDTTDGEIIRDFFCEEVLKLDVAYKIYYHKDDSKKQHITNLVKVLTKEKVVKLCDSNNQRIEFISSDTIDFEIKKMGN